MANALTKLSEEAAEALAKHQGLLHLDGLISLSDIAAEILAKHDGVILLRGGAAETFSKYKKGYNYGLNSK